MVLKLGSAGRNLLDGNTSWDEVARQALSTWNPYVGTIQFEPTIQSPGVGSDGDRLNQAFFSSTVYMLIRLVQTHCLATGCFQPPRWPAL